MRKIVTGIAIAIMALIITVVPTYGKTENRVGPSHVARHQPVIQIIMPSTVGPNESFTYTVKINNPTGHRIYFEGSVWEGGPAWGGEDYVMYTSPGTRIYDVHGDQNGLRNYWKGHIGRYQSVTLVDQVKSSDSLGTYQKFLKLNIWTTLNYNPWIIKHRSLTIR